MVPGFAVVQAITPDERIPKDSDPENTGALVLAFDCISEIVRVVLRYFAVCLEDESVFMS